MKHSYFRGWLLLLLATAFTAQAQLEPAAQYTTLTPAQLMAWTSTGATALPANVSTVPLATRQNSLAAQLNPNQSFSAKVNWCPDGMNNFVGYLNEQPRFNLYNFTHWQYIDVLTWFASPVGIPCRPWTEAAHRNGVKIIGTIFTDAAGFNTLLQRDAAGNYIGAQKLVDVANYYGFDGWFFNEESQLTATQATELMNLLKRLQAIKPAGMEIHWYDSMLPNGRIAYQNTLNTANAPLLQDGTARVSDAIFTNYFWQGATTFNTAVATANSLGRSPFDVYTGADVWPGRNPQQLFNQTTWLDNYYTNANPAQPRTSLAVFAPNITFNSGLTNFNNDAGDYVNFYRAEQRLFAGNDYDVTTADASGWKGFGHFVPVRSAINTLPFETNFCVGQGKIFANNGVVVAHEWTNMAQQRLLPSWQWAKTGASTVSVGFDFNRAWYGGNSVALAGSLAAGATATVKLYQTKLTLQNSVSVDVTYKAATAGPSNAKLALYFSDDLNNPTLFDLPAVTDTLWTTTSYTLTGLAAGRELAIVGVQATSATAVASFRTNLGNLRIYNGTIAPSRPTAAFTANSTTVLTGQPVQLANASVGATSFTWTFDGGTPASSTAVHPTVTYATAGTYAVKLRAENATGRDSLTRTSYITVTTAPPAGRNTSLRLDGSSKYAEAGTIDLGNGSGLSLECWVKANTFKVTNPYISSLLGMEDGGSNTALLRLGDAGIDANQVQFVLQVANATRKVTSATRLTAGTWYHIAATYDGRTMRLYINGVQDASFGAIGFPVANAPFSLGRNNSSPRILDGWLDEMRAWTRALTPAEIAANACNVPPASMAGLAGYWRCNDSPALAAIDGSGNGHTARFVGLTAADWSLDVPTVCGTIAGVRNGQSATGPRLAILGNPATGTEVEVEVSRAAGQPATLRLLNSLGAVVLTREVKPGSDAARYTLPLHVAPGIYLLELRTALGTTSAKLLKE
ncbi:LamG-like jellyroll fold domain-containing protein [Hymenobacter sp. ASUV-10]|uniref:LamG-like jellyroll fold domain-containing protein n=1 Tax=Hymenobacter aranciens TaxID=3063996 RepID=A0ABT9BJ72_9BACT|nr:LamG-like jellyroll fold domain-containing protein [Hymenobacter sp. ASUV-10]MDO7876701.1 LamG-like jellyroll fold domain-containing protein [Hymenobacter sp. ASUV-10]